MNYFYPINELQRLNVFKHMTTYTILDLLVDTDKYIESHNYKLTLEQWTELQNMLLFSIKPICFYDEILSYKASCFIFEMMYTIYSDTKEKITYSFQHKSDTVMYSIATHEDERYAELFQQDETDPIKLSFINEMKKCYNANYKKISMYFGVKPDDVKTYGYNEWSELQKRMIDYNYELKSKNHAPIYYNDNLDAENIKPAHRPVHEQIIKMVNADTDETLENFPNRNAIIEKIGIKKNRLSQLIKSVSDNPNCQARWSKFKYNDKKYYFIPC